MALLVLVCVISTGVRVYRLSTPVAKPPSQGYIFDERYYVSAARLIADQRVTRGDVYFHAAPVGDDPNAEHPQLGKLVIAGSIELFGDNAIGWRISAVAFGLASILLLYWLVRCAGGSAWLALGAASLAGFDNLWLVHSRIAVLDIYAVPFMLAGAALYLRRGPLIAGLLIGIGCCVKEFAAYTLPVLVLLEVMRGLAGLFARRRGRRTAAAGGAAGPVDAPAGAHADAPARADLTARADVTAPETTPPRAPAPEPAPPTSFRRSLLHAVTVCVVGVVTYFTLLTVLDTLVTPYSGHRAVDRNESSICKYTLIWKDACNHFAFMNKFAAELTDNGSPKGIATTPLDFWINRKAITYYATSTTVTVGRKVVSTQKVLWFRGEISRVLLITSWLALLLNLWWAIRRRDDLSFLVLAWALGTWLPPEIFHAIGDRTVYLYYMVVTMPALYIGVARLLGLAWIPGARRWLSLRRAPLLLLAAWVVAFLLDFANLYPFRTL